jgi:hypothetical protein
MSNADAKYTIDDHVAKALARLPSMHDDSLRLRDGVSIHAARMQKLENVMRGITPEDLFDVDTAIGVQLDQIGTIVGIARESRTDASYRVILRTQSLLVLPERRTQARLMEIIRSLMDTDPGAIIYEQIPPKSYKLTVATAALGTLLSWVPILRRTRPATYDATLGWTATTHITYGDESGVAVPKTWLGYGDSSGTIAETWGGFGAAIPF